MRRVSALFVRSDSVYFDLPDVDCWPADVDARHFSCRTPVVAHPPCRAWGRLRHLAKPLPSEFHLSILAMWFCRMAGGVVEHPTDSRLWNTFDLVRGQRDAFGGWLMPVSQKWWGHRCEKPTILYICGAEPRDLPPVPYSMARATHSIDRPKNRSSGRPLLKRVGHAERERTPPLFSEWLVAVARSCRV
jgi:hypothetical protein